MMWKQERLPVDKSTVLTRKPIVWVDFIRSISIVLVVVIHSTGPLLNKWKEIISSTDWMVADFLVSFSRASVPLMFMISGYLLLSRQESISDFYMKRFRKVIVPLIIWSIFYLVWQNGYRNYTIINMVKAIVYEILTGPASYHFWFLYALIAIYILTPLIRRFTFAAEEIHLWYAVGAWFIFGPIKKMVERVFGFEVAIDFGFLVDYVGYFLMGYLLGRMKFSKKVFVLAVVTYLIAAGYTVFATYALSNLAGDYDGYYQWYLTLNAALMSCGAFVVLKTLGENISNEKLGEWLHHFASVSFGIYLIHVFFLIVLKRNGFDAFSGPAIISAPTLSLSVFVLSWLSVVILQKIPVLREIVPN
ncbi:MAG: acyltransferase family protein [Anaerolineales bacterium]